jgi:CRISPR-associated protein Cst1
MGDNVGLNWTYHPLVDLGIATITAFSGHDSPAEVTFDNLEKFSDYAERTYFIPVVDEKGKSSFLLGGYLAVLFTSNFINPSWIKKAKKEKRKDEYYYAKRYVHKILRSFKYQPDLTLPKCAYCGKPSIRQPTSNLAYRDLIPMLTGRRVINFFPGGRSGLPLCGLCTIAIQAIAIGAPICSGRALIVSSDDPFLTLALVKKWLPETMTRIQLSETTGQKLPKIGRPLTRTVEALVSLERERINLGENSGLTVFHLSNSGQGPNIDIYDLPANIVRFVMRAQGIRYRQIWQSIIRRSWEPSKDEVNADATLIKKHTRRSRKSADGPSLLERRNFLFEDLFSLPAEAGRFIRTYFFQQPTKTGKHSDPRKAYKGWRDAEYIKWDLTELFLKEVVAMEKSRIEAIRNLGDRIADEIASNNDKRLWWDVYTVQNYYGLRNILIRESQKYIRVGKEPLIKFNPFLEIFEEGEELARVDWRLAWDLVVIRVIEKLYEKKWFEQNKEVLETEISS